MEKFCETNSPVNMLWCSMKCRRTFKSGMFKSNTADATERVPPSGELGSGRADNSLARGRFLSYKAGR
jgi:hypothetical protein